MRALAVGGNLENVASKIERLESEKTAIAEDIKTVYDEAKSCGFDVSILRHVIKLRKADQRKIAEQEALLEVYQNALNFS